MIFKKKKLPIEKYLVVAEDDNNVRPKSINELFDDVRSIHFFKLYTLFIF